MTNWLIKLAGEVEQDIEKLVSGGPAQTEVINSINTIKTGVVSLTGQIDAFADQTIEGALTTFAGPAAERFAAPLLESLIDKATAKLQALEAQAAAAAAAVTGPTPPSTPTA